MLAKAALARKSAFPEQMTKGVFSLISEVDSDEIEMQDCSCNEKRLQRVCTEQRMSRLHPGGQRVPHRARPRTGGENATIAVARILQDLRARGGLQGKDVANIVDVSTATVSRWSHGNGSPNLRTQTVIADLRYVVDRLSDFYTPDETRLWLHSRHQLLNGERAIDLINADRTEEVLAVIERLAAGAYI